MTKHTLTVPRRFWDDYCDRHSPDCEEIERTYHSVITLDDDQLADLLSDARHYAQGWVDEAPKGLIKSARVVVEEIERHLTSLEA